MSSDLRHVLTILAVEDLERATRFYEQALGRRPHVQTETYTELALPNGQRLGLYQRAGFARNTGRPAAEVGAGQTTASEIYFHCDDLAATIARLRAAGAEELSPLSPRPWGDEAAYFADPAGNVLVVARPLPDQALPGGMSEPEGGQRFTRTDSRTAPAPSRPAPQPNVPIRTSDHELEPWSEGQRFAGRDLPLSRLAGASQVHVNLTVVPAGKQSCPAHYHLREEEHFYVLERRCVLRAGEQRFVVEQGDYVCFPAGQAVAHAFENPFPEDCLLLAIGPHDAAEIAVYPDSGKAKLRAADTIVRWPQRSLDYWDGEPVDEPIADAAASPTPPPGRPEPSR